MSEKEKNEIISVDADEKEEKEKTEPEESEEKPEPEKAEEKSEKEDASENDENSDTGEDEEKSSDGEEADEQENRKEKTKTGKKKKGDNFSDTIRKNEDQLLQKKSYRVGKYLYDIGLILLCACFIFKLVLFFTNTEIIIGDSFCSVLNVGIYLIPIFIMLAGLIVSASTARKEKLKTGDRSGLVFVTVITVFLVGLAVLEVVHPSKVLCDKSEMTLREGETLTVVKYVSPTLFDPIPVKTPVVHDLAIYRTNGIFAKKLAGAEGVFNNWKITENKEKGGYLLKISNSDHAESQPFSYN